jgi:hypothetical protein
LPPGRPQPPDQVDTVHTRHHHIQKNGIEIAGFGSMDSLQAVAGYDDGVVLLF